MLKRALFILLISVSIGLILSAHKSVSGQAVTVHTFPPFVATPEYSQALSLVQNTNTRDRGVQQFLAVADANPNTTLGVKSLFAAAHWSEDNNFARSIYLRVSKDYADSRFDMAARLFYLQGDPALTTATWATQIEQIIARFGGPNLHLITTNRTAALLQLKSLPQEYQDGMTGLYYQYARALGALKQYRQAIPVAALGAEAFSGAEPARSQYQYLVKEYTAATQGGIPNFTSVRTDPIIKILSPGQTTGPRSVVSLKAWTGDYTHARVSLPDSTFIVDGVDVTSQVVSHIQFSKVFKQGPQFIWQKDTWSYRPTQPFAPGRHEVSVAVRTGGYQANHETGPGATTVRWHFYVRRDCRDDDDYHFQDDDDS